MSFVADLMKDLSDRKRQIFDDAMKLIREDAPKNKFTILAGRLREIEDTESTIQKLGKRDS